jgi:DNA-binding transcriptional MocR family regulator
LSVNHPVHPGRILAQLPSTRSFADEYGIGNSTLGHDMALLRDRGAIVAFRALTARGCRASRTLPRAG